MTPHDWSITVEHNITDREDWEYEDMYPEPAGFMGATAHDFDDHRRCDPRACPNAEQEN